MSDKVLADGKKLQEQDDGTFAEVVSITDTALQTEAIREQTQILKQIRFGISLLVDVDLSNISE